MTAISFNPIDLTAILAQEQIIPLYPKPLRSIFFSVLMMLFVLAGVLLVLAEQLFIGVFCIVFFGAGAFILITAAFRKIPLIIISPIGTHHFPLFRKPRYIAWDDIEDFNVIHINHQTLINLFLYESVSKKSWSQRLNHSVGFGQASIAITGLNYSIDELSMLFELILSSPSESRWLAIQATLDLKQKKL